MKEVKGKKEVVEWLNSHPMIKKAGICLTEEEIVEIPTKSSNEKIVTYVTIVNNDLFFVQIGLNGQARRDRFPSNEDGWLEFHQR